MYAIYSYNLNDEYIMVCTNHLNIKLKNLTLKLFCPDCLVPLTTVSRRGIPESCLSNKLNRLTLATFDDEGK